MFPLQTLKKIADPIFLYMNKKIFLALLLLISISSVILLLAARYTDRLIDPYIRSLLEEQKPINHRIDYKKIRVNLFTKIIKISDVRMYPDSSLVKDENLWFEINVSTIKLTDFSIIDMLFHKSLHIGDFLVIKPSVVMNLPRKPADKIIKEVTVDSVLVASTPLLTSIALERLILSGGTFRLIHDNKILASSPEINFIGQQITLKKNSSQDPIGYSYGDINVFLSNIILNPESGLYDMSLGSFAIHKKDSSVVLKDFRMIPKYDKKEFPKHSDFQSNRLDVKVGRIDVAGVGFVRLLEGLPLNISKILIDSVYADIYRNKNIPVDPNKFPLFFNESFLKISLPLVLDTVMITNSRLLYNELAEGKTTAGEIMLNDFNISTYGLSNFVIDSSIKNEMKVFINAKIMDEGPMHVELDLPLQGNLRDFRCIGSVGAMELFPVNGMLEPSLHMIFKTGKLNRLTFDFTANDNVSRGWMEFLYQDLDVVLLKKEPGKEFGFLSFMANSMTLSNNPSHRRDLKTVEIGFERDKNKGIIGYIWRTIQSGLVRTILPTNKYRINKTPPPVQKENNREKRRKGN